MHVAPNLYTRVLFTYLSSTSSHTILQNLSLELLKIWNSDQPEGDEKSDS